jgi:hypothetical protein
VPLRQNAEEKAIRVYDKGRGKSCGCVCLIATGLKINLVYYESIKRKLKTGPIYECRCDERLKTKAEESTRLAYTGLLGELEHLKIETRLIRRDEI